MELIVSFRVLDVLCVHLVWHFQIVTNPNEESTVQTDFTGAEGKEVEIVLTPKADETDSITIKDLGIEACIEKGIPLSLLFLYLPHLFSVDLTWSGL